MAASFFINLDGLDRILVNIKIAEEHSAGSTLRSNFFPCQCVLS